MEVASILRHLAPVTLRLRLFVIFAAQMNKEKTLHVTYRYTEQFPNALQVVAIGRTQGHQAIHRAELQALLVLFEQLDRFEAYTDSATAIACIDACRRAVDLEELADHDDFDLLQRFFLTVSREKKVHKIKAHQKLVDISDDLLLFRALGNHMADQSANKVCVELLPEVVAQLEEFSCRFLSTTRDAETVFRSQLTASDWPELR